MGRCWRMKHLLLPVLLRHRLHAASHLGGDPRCAGSGHPGRTNLRSAGPGHPGHTNLRCAGSGHPGRTSRLLTVAELEYVRDWALPFRLGVLKRKEVLK